MKTRKLGTLEVSELGFGFIVPIPGTAKVQHLQENIESSNVVLTADDIKEIASALSNISVHGGRMNEQQMKIVQA